MSNEEFAVMIQAGRRELLLDLWAQVRRMAWKFLPRGGQRRRLAG